MAYIDKPIGAKPQHKTWRLHYEDFQVDVRAETEAGAWEVAKARGTGEPVKVECLGLK